MNVGDFCVDPIHCNSKETERERERESKKEGERKESKI